MQTCQHTIFQPNCPACRKLQKDWYAKLRGFKDCEDTSKSDFPLKEYHSVRTQLRRTDVEKEAIEKYYATARKLLLRYRFKNQLHRRIWELHCEGLSMRKIEVQIKHFKKAIKAKAIWNLIKKISENLKCESS